MRSRRWTRGRWSAWATVSTTWRRPRRWTRWSRAPWPGWRRGGTGSGSAAITIPARPRACRAGAADSLRLGRVALRHQAGPGPDISGHFHPAVRLAGERRRAFLLGDDHLLLPAFGAYTGGLLQDDPALAALVPRGLAIACGTRAIPLPLGLPRRQRR
ncbi:hypothetical protein [Paracoccus thiocyanatus]|uniref:hypothetical protein n=1 Tax=Paracoccus thiocyanatus TaxID=34006 RepID=UPI0026D91EED